MAKRRIKKLPRHYVGALDGRSIPTDYHHQVTADDSLRFRVVTECGLEVECTFQAMAGVFDFAGKKPTLIEVCRAIEEMYALVATDQILQRPRRADRLSGGKVVGR